MPVPRLVEDVDCLQPPRLRRIIQLAEMTEGSLPGTIRGPHRLDERPIRMSLAVFVAMMRPEKHTGRMLARAIRGRKRVGLHYIANRTTPPLMMKELQS
jgi:hypothetical protein